MSDLKPGKYRMTIEVEIDEDGYLLPHDSGEMFMADWWVQNDATFGPVPPPQCNECGWWLTTNPASCPSCGTPTGLGVSGEDRSEPTPTPRRWQRGDKAAWRGRVVDVVGVTSDGKGVSIDDHGEVLFDRDATELSEVVSPEGTP